MRHRASIQTVPTRTPQRTNGYGLLLVLDHLMRKLVISPQRQSPSLRPFAWAQANEGDSLAMGSTHSPLLQPDSVASDHRVCVRAVALAPLYERLQVDVSIARQFSRIFPAHPRSLASVLIPRPAARRGSAFTAFRKSFRQISAQDADEKIFRTFRKSAAWPWERGTLASLRARVSRG